MADEPADLPWVRADGEAPSGTGICLSGGGIRAASFALGALQALQAQRGLLFGKCAADHLAVVSGGSYIGATFMLNAVALAQDDEGAQQPAPLAEGSPEAAHVIAHGHYLVAEGWLRTIVRLFGLLAWNVAAVAVLFGFTGTMLADYAYLAERWGPEWVEPPDGLLRWLLALAAVGGGTLLLRASYIDGGPKRALYPVLGLALVAGMSPSLLSVLGTLRERSGDIGWWWAALAAGAAALLAMSAAPPSRLGRALWWTFAEAAVMVPRFVGLVLLTIAALWMDGILDRGLADDATVSQSITALVAFFGTLIAAVLFGGVSNRVSLDRFYRDGLSRCFAVRRDGNAATTVAPTATPLSAVSPEGVAAARKFPRLLVCATANVIWRQAKTRRRFAPFVMSHDRCGIPGAPGHSFATSQLELGRVPSRILHQEREPLLALMTAVASTGAAVSPSMGNRTYPALRPLIAVANVRLGRWLPNPLSAPARRRVAERSEPGSLIKGTVLGPGYDEFVPELFGLHRADGQRVYISDGGHYDNLGLLSLLRARCEEIWCVDSDADGAGDAGQLRTVIKLACTELGATIDLDLDVFAAADGVLGAPCAIGSIAYRGGGTGRIVVIKLGLTEGTADDLLAYRRENDPKWPYHSTFLAGQWYSAARIDAYRRLGCENASAAAQAVTGDAQAAT